MSEKKPDIISLFDGRVGFWGRWAVSYGTLLACIGLGVIIQSDALQWIGAILWFVGIISTSVSYATKAHKTPQEAADYLAKTYGVKAQ
jgi:hypothetical protein